MNQDVAPVSVIQLRFLGLTILFEGMMRKFLTTMVCLCFFLPCLSIGQVYGPTKNCVDLWTIALQVRSSHKVTVSQAVVGIFKKNPNAFYGHNLNGLKPGVKLAIPTMTEMKKVSPEAAQKEIRNQTKTWPALRKYFISKHLIPEAHCGKTQAKKTSTQPITYEQRITKLQNEIAKLKKNMPASVVASIKQSQEKAYQKQIQPVTNQITSLQKVRQSMISQNPKALLIIRAIQYQINEMQALLMKLKDLTYQQQNELLVNEVAQLNQQLLVSLSVAHTSQLASINMSRSFARMFSLQANQLHALHLKLNNIVPSRFSKVVNQLFVSTISLSPKTASIKTGSQVQSDFFSKYVGVYLNKISRVANIQPGYILVIFLLLILLLILMIASHKKNVSGSETKQKNEKLSGATPIERDLQEDEEAPVVSEEQNLEENEVPIEEDLTFEESEEPAEVTPEEASKEKNYQFLAGEDIQASKLDLGKALIEMGNIEHAKKVLESVIEEGDEQQKAEASKLLKKVSE